MILRELITNDFFKIIIQTDGEKPSWLPPFWCLKEHYGLEPLIYPIVFFFILVRYSIDPFSRWSPRRLPLWPDWF